MANTRRMLELGFAIGGKIDPAFTRATGEAGKQIEALAKKNETAAKAAKLQREQAKQLAALEKSAASMRKSWGAVGASIMGPIKTLAKLSAVVGGAAYAIGATTGVAADQAGKAAKKIGISARAFSEWVYAADQASVSQESLSGAMIKLNKNIAAAAQGSKEARLAFRRAGVSIYDASGKVKNADQIMLEASRTFAKMPEGIYKSDLAMAIFGKSGADLVPLMEQGSDAIKKMREQAGRLGLVLDDTATKKATGFADSLTESKGATKGLGMAIGSQLWEPLTELNKTYTEWIVANREWLSLKVGEAVKKFQEYWPTLKKYIIEAKDAIVRIWTTLDGMAQSMGGWESVLKKLFVAWAAFKGIQIAGSIWTAYSATSKFIGLVLKGGPGLVAFQSKMLAGGNLFGWLGTKIVAVLAKVGAAILANPLFLWVGIIAAVCAGIYVLYKRWDDFIGYFTGAWAEVKAAFDKGFVQGIWAFFKNFNPLTLIVKAINAVIEYFTGVNLISIVNGWLVGMDNLLGSWSPIAIFSRAWEAFMGYFTQACTNVKNAFGEGVLNGIIALITNFHPASIMVSALNSLVKAIFGIDLLAKGKEWFNKFIDGMLAAITGIGSKIKDAIMDKIPSLSDITGGLKGAAGSAVESVKGWLPKFGNGGWVTKPTMLMAGEGGGAEVIIPMNKPNRAMELLTQAAQRLGMESPAAGLSRAVSVNNSRTSVGGPSFSFAPNITVTGGDAAGVKQAVDSAVQSLKGEFEKWARNLDYQNARTAMR